MTRAFLPLAFLGLLPAPLFGQVPMTFNVPKETAQRVIDAQVLACQVAETASGAELDGLDLALQRIVGNLDQRVQRASRDSAAVMAAQREYANAVARIKPLQAQLDPLDVRKIEINTAQKPYEDDMAAARQGDASTGQSPLAQLEEQIKGLDDQHARWKDEYDKIPDKDNWLQGRDEQLMASMRENREQARPLIRERDRIIARISRNQDNPAYKALVAEEGTLDVKIATLKEQIRELETARDNAKRTLEDSASPEEIGRLEELHEINGFVDQYLQVARECVRKRRAQLAGAAPPATPGAPAAPAGGGGFSNAYLSGRWDTNCSGDLPANAPRTDGGDMNFYFSGGTSDDPELKVHVTFVGSQGKPVLIGLEGYGARGRVLDDGTIETYRNDASFYSLAWTGKLEADLSRGGANIGVAAIPTHFKGSGTVTISNLYREGGGTCTGTWTAATP